mmetsp:Transcript_20061/g.36253  ORF Transcript_20061/g.36253 Transcript_20061/m.36253 type:complete len:287 (-) Transcript_20061:103-963(-)
MAANESDDLLSLIAIVPRSGGHCEEYEIQVSKHAPAEKLKQEIEKLTSIPADDQELFCKANLETGTKNAWLDDNQTLSEQSVLSGSIVTVGVHGRIGATRVEAETEDGSNDAVQSSMDRHGDASYYFAHSQKYELPEEQRIVAGGVPQKLGEDPSAAPPTPPDILNAGGLVLDEDFAPKRAERHMRNYSWGDERDFVKVYVSKDSEEEAITAAGDGKNGVVEVIFKERKFKLIVHAAEKDYVLLLERVYYEILPEESTFKVSANKRITISMKKKEKTTWLKLLKPE